MYTCNQIAHDLTDMSDGYTVTEVTTHKEEKPSRVRSDEEDRERIREKLQSDYPDRVINIVTVRIGHEKVNAPNAVDTGRRQMRSFEERWPCGFNATFLKS